MNAKGESRDGRRSQLSRPEYQALRTALERALKNRGIGQRELSRRLEKPEVYINRVLQGRRTLEFAELLDICTELAVPVAEIVAEATGYRSALPADPE